MPTDNAPACNYKMHEVTGDTRTILPAFAKIRARVFVIDPELGAKFARESNRSWKEYGFRGLAMACADLAEDLKDVPGAWDLYVAARNLGR